MTVHFRRSRLSRADELGAAAVSLLIGAGAAAATFYVTRLLLSRERLSDVPRGSVERAADAARSLPAADAEG